MLAVIYLTPLQMIFGTAPLDPTTWVLLYSLAPLVLVLEEVRKSLVRARQ